MSKPSLKLIEWEDAYSGHNSWTSLSDFEEGVEPLIINTIGFEIHRDSDRLLLSMAYDESNQKVADMFCIPIGMIRKETTLSE